MNKIAESAKIAEDVILGDNITIEDDVFIDSHCIIRDNVYIKKGTKIGVGCILGEYLSDLAVDNSKKAIVELMDLKNISKMNFYALLSVRLPLSA